MEGKDIKGEHQLWMINKNKMPKKDSSLNHYCFLNEGAAHFKCSKLMIRGRTWCDTTLTSHISFCWVVSRGNWYYLRREYDATSGQLSLQLVCKPRSEKGAGDGNKSPDRVREFSKGPHGFHLNGIAEYMICKHWI